MAGLHLCSLGPPGTKTPIYRAINFPINYKAKVVLGYNLEVQGSVKAVAKQF